MEFKIRCLKCGYEGNPKEFINIVEEGEPIELGEDVDYVIYLKCPKCGHKVDVQKLSLS